MTDITLTHTSSGRPDVQFLRAQDDRRVEESVADVVDDIGVRDPPRATVEGRGGTRRIQGRMTGAAASSLSGFSSDWRTALAEWLVRLEAAIDEFQGLGYTLDDQERGLSLPVVVHACQWTIQAGRPFEATYRVDVTIGKNTQENRSADPKTATPGAKDSSPFLTGVQSLTGLQTMRVEREFDIEVDPINFDPDVEATEVRPTSRPKHVITYNGEKAGTETERQTFDNGIETEQSDLESLSTFETVMPGYDLDGKIMNYRSDWRASRGTGIHDYEITFLEAIQG